MTATFIQSQEYAGAAATSTVTLTGVTTGNTIFVSIEVFDASTLTSLTDDKSNTYTLDLSERNQANSGNVQLYRASNVTGGTVVITALRSALYSHRWYAEEASGIANSAPEVSMTRATGGLSTTPVISFTPISASAYARLYASYNATQTATANATGFTPLNTVAARGGMSAYKANCGAVGAKTGGFTLLGSVAWAVSGLVYATVSTDPTVTSVTSTTTPEGTATVHTVTLSAATTSDVAYAYAWSGGATGADYTQTLTTAMCARTGGASGNVTVSGSNITAETGVSAFSITVPTVQDALDEDNETIVLTVGGVASTGGTITDDDAAPSISITPSITVDSGDSVVLTYTLGAVSGRVTQARLVLTDCTKIGGVDYTNVITDGMFTTVSGSGTVTISAGVLSIPAGVVSFTITIPTTP